MKIFFILSALLIVGHAKAGLFVEKSLYFPHTFLVGKGSTPEEARKDAESALPLGIRGLRYQLDSKNSAAVQCLNEPVSGLSLDNCPANKWQAVMPVVQIKR